MNARGVVTQRGAFLLIYFTYPYFFIYFYFFLMIIIQEYVAPKSATSVDRAESLHREKEEISRIGSELKVSVSLERSKVICDPKDGRGK